MKRSPGQEFTCEGKCRLRYPGTGRKGAQGPQETFLRQISRTQMKLAIASSSAETAELLRCIATGELNLHFHLISPHEFTSGEDPSFMVIF